MQLEGLPVGLENLSQAKLTQFFESYAKSR